MPYFNSHLQQHKQGGHLKLTEPVTEHKLLKSCVKITVLKEEETQRQCTQHY